MAANPPARPPVLFSAAAIEAAFGARFEPIGGSYYPRAGRAGRDGSFYPVPEQPAFFRWCPQVAGHPEVTPVIAWVHKYLAKFRPEEPIRCLRHHFSAGVVKQDALLLPSYNGAPRGSVNCDELGECNKSLYRIPVGGHGVPHTGDEYCPAVHAEENVICAAARLGIALSGTDLFITGIDPDGSTPDCTPCYGCAKLLRACGFRLVVANNPRYVTVRTPADLEIVKAVHGDLLQVGAPGHW